METALVVLFVFAAFVVGLILRDFFPSYVREKAKNLATKEDIRGITHEIESVKNEYAHQLEMLRSDLQSRVRIFEVRYQNEFDILLELSERLVALRDAASSLRPIADYAIAGETEAERKKRRLSAYDEASQALYGFAEARRPFFTEDIHAATHELLHIARKEAIQYSNRKPEGEDFATYWDEAQKNADTIRELSEKAVQAIRDRVRVWEPVEPGERERR